MSWVPCNNVHTLHISTNKSSILRDLGRLMGRSHFLPPKVLAQALYHGLLSLQHQWLHQHCNLLQQRRYLWTPMQKCHLQPRYMVQFHLKTTCRGWVDRCQCGESLLCQTEPACGLTTEQIQISVSNRSPLAFVLLAEPLLPLPICWFCQTRTTSSREAFANYSCRLPTHTVRELWNCNTQIILSQTLPKST